MRFGLFYEHQQPRPWEDGSTERLLTDALEQVELADRHGIDCVWEVEHHFLEEYSHSSAPEVFLAAASQRTERIRLGHGIVQLPPAFNHPARIAERAATLDLISGGRVELGTGEATSQAELGGFGVDRDSKRAQWEESLGAIARMFVEEPFAGIQGEYVQMPPRNVMPKPKQRPHPPLWVACSRRDTILMAARKGIGALTFSFVEPEDAAEWVDEYYALIASEECVPAGFAVNPNFAVVLPLMVHEDEATAIERGIDGAHFFGYSLAHYYVFGEHVPGRTDIWEQFQRDRTERGFAREIVTPDDAPLGVRLLQEGFGSLRGAIGTPDQVVELCERYERAGVDQVIFVLQAGRNRHEHVCESIELFGERVVPRFAERADEREAEKRERLAEACERALARREPPRTAPDDYVITPQSEPTPATAMRASSRGRGSSGRSGNGGGGGLADRLGKLGEAAFASFVRGRSDDQLDRLIGSDAALRVVFAGMERAFVPDRADGFSGAIQYEIESGRGTRTWHVAIDDGRARAVAGPATEPTVTLHARAPVFARLVARELNPGKALLDGDLTVSGDFDVAARIGEMFGEPSSF
ncbi:MAG TPA: LLM class flavin-dependent oxidoreductase [Thermoleophilaceae bacterium]|jgi:alkanesulfonate monooxygenase SsuD/methylene tetrahydromethanopterin reductase-like flavin-dependent oxidoreductase (luciferase family)/putative sterol carrier protein